MANVPGLDWTMDGMNNPLLIQERLLDRFEEETGTVIVDPNNPASVLMEAFASTTAGIVRNVEQQVRAAIYPARANNAFDLYKHLSDYDYIDVFASPAQAELQLVVDKVYVLLNSVDVPGANYKKLVIPSTTRFTVGEHTFGIYYPIEIRSNMDTGRFTVVYDTTHKNPLKSLNNNALEYDIRKYSGHDLVFIKIPVYQFNIDHLEEGLGSTTGFKTVIPYEDKFYAIRCKAEVLKNFGHDETEEDIYEEEELALCCSGQVYDPETPTVVFTPDLEHGECTVEVPFVYFTNNTVRGTLTIDLYTTKGAMSYTVPTDTEEVCTIDIFSQIEDEETATYADPFKKMPALQVLPLSTTIVGGADGMTYETLKQRVVTGTIKSKTLQTPDDIDAYFANRGYVSTLLRDGVTDRIFLVHATVKNMSNEIIGADTIGTLFDFRDSVRADYDTIVQSGPDTFTIYPSTLYKLDENKGVCYPLTTVERQKLLNLVPNEKVAAFNNNIYTLSPYHLQVDISTKYPSTVTYDMTDAAIVSSEFIADRVEPSCQLILNNSILSRERGDIKDSYRLTFRVSRAGLDDVNAVVSEGDAVGKKNFRCIVGIKNDDGVFNFGEAVWDNWTGEYDIFHIDFDTSYKFHQANNNHTLMMKLGSNPETDVFLTAEVRVMLLIDGDINSVKQVVGKDNHCLVTDFSNVSAGIIDSVANYYALNETKLMCKFGSVINEIDQRINLAYSEMEYLKYPTTKFKSIEVPIYERNADGSLVFSNDTVTFVRSTDTVWDDSKVYYSKSGDTYTVCTDSSLTPSASLYEQVRTATITEKFPAGTLTCVTKTCVDSMILNNHTVHNYQGGAASYRDSETGETRSTVIAESTPNDFPGVTMSLTEAPVIPRFFVTSGDEHVDEGKCLALGSYDLEDAAHQPATSSPNNIWNMTGLNGRLVTEGGTVRIKDYHNNIVAIDALYYLFNEVIGSYNLTTGEWTANEDYVVEGGYTTTTPLKGIVGDVGQFIVVRLDDSNFDNTVPVVDYLDSKQYGAPPDVARCVIYCCVDVTRENGLNVACKWIPVVQGSSLANMAAFVYDYTQTAQFKQAFGYIYKLSAQCDSSVGTGMSQQTFIAWLNTKTVDGYTVPDFTRFYLPNYKEVTDVNQGDTLLPGWIYFQTRYDEDPDTHVQTLVEMKEILFDEGDTTVPATEEGYDKVQRLQIDDPIYNWSNLVFQWPWDVKKWWIATKDGSVTQGTTITEGIYRATESTLFATRFDSARLDRYCEYTSGQLWLKNGQLQEAPGTSRTIQYLIDMIQIDAKMSQTTANKMTRAFPSNVTSVIRDHCELIGECRQEMFTNTRLFFEPCKSIGFAEFDIGDSETAKIRMDVSVGFKLYVLPGIASSTTTLEDIRATIIQIIDDKISQSHVLNLPDVSTEIMAQLGDSIQRIDILGINGDVNLQTIKCTDKEAQVHLGHQLTLLSDGTTIDIGRALELQVVTVNS